jgi:hypothetical protein
MSLLINLRIRTVVFPLCLLGVFFLYTANEANALTGYYFAVSSGAYKKKLSLNFSEPANAQLNEEKILNNFNISAVSGYIYPLPKSLYFGGQVFFGYSAQDRSIDERWTHNAFNTANWESYAMSSSLTVRSRASTGFDFLCGANIKGFFIFASGGINLQFPKIRGAIVGEVRDIKFGTYFGKDKKFVDGVDFPEVKSTFHCIPSFSVGYGVRRYFVDKFFVGLDFKHIIKREKDLKVKYAVYDPRGIAGGSSYGAAVVEKNKKVIPMKFQNFGVGLIIGLKL